MKCANCEAELSPTDRFCTDCGHRVDAPVELASPSELHEPADAPGEVLCLEGHQARLAKVAFTANGSQAVSASEDGVMYRWDLASGKPLQRVLGVGPVSAVAITSDGRRALTFANSMHLWDLEGGREIQRYPVKGYIISAALTDDGRRALFADTENDLHLWDLDNGRELHCLHGHAGMIDCMTFSPDGRYALSGAMEPDYSDRAVILWDLERGSELGRPERQMMLVAGLAFSPDGRRAIASTLDAFVFLWEVESGFELRRFDGHSGNIHCCAFSPDGRRLLSGSGTDDLDEDLQRDLGIDNTVRLWDAERQREICRFEGHRGDVKAVAFSPDGRYALSGSNDTTVRVWRLPA